MSEVRRRWSEDDYYLWKRQIGEILLCDHPADPNLQVEVLVDYDDPREQDGVIRVSVVLQGASRFNILLPSDSFLVENGGQDDRC
jgi:hypothetical protein